MTQPITIFGMDHSPWVHGVMLALTQRELPYRVVPHPSSVSAYASHGIVMPAVQWPDGTVTSDSFAIYEALQHRYGGTAAPVSSDDQRRLERLFLSYVLSRFGRGKRLRFIRGWARTPDQPQQLSSTLGRSVLAVYFTGLITLGIGQARLQGHIPYDPDRFRQELHHWDMRAHDSQPFLCGERPGPIDWALAGHLQCMASGLTDELFPILREFPSLMGWLQRIHVAFETHPRLYSRRIFDIQQTPPPADRIQQAAFYGALVFLALNLPLSALIFADASVRRWFNPNHSGARLRASWPNRRESSATSRQPTPS